MWLKPLTYANSGVTIKNALNWVQNVIFYGIKMVAEVIKTEDKALKEIETNTEANTEEKNVKTILGLDFYGLRKFFHKEFLEFKENKITVFVTRRCLLLAKYFFNLVADKESITLNKSAKFPYIESGNKRNYILSDKADIDIMLNGCDSEEYPIKNITIVDDICIHGETIKQTSDYVKDYLSTRNKEIEVKTHVYMCSDDSIRIRPDVYDKVSYRAEWLNLSRQIVNLTSYLNIPYVSYLNSYTWFNIKQETFERIIKNISNQGNICKEYGESDQRASLGKISYFVAEKEVKQYDKELFKFIRIYYSKEHKSVVVVPYVVIDKLSEGTSSDVDTIIKTTCTFLKRYLADEKSEEICNILKKLTNKDHKESRLNSFAYCLVSCIASQVYGTYFKETYLKTLKGCKQDHYGFLNMAFGTKLSNIIQKLGQGQELDKGPGSVSKLLDPDQFNSWLGKTEMFVKKECEAMWVHYENRDNECRTMPLNEMLDKMGESLKDSSLNCQYALLFNLINLCDLGKISITCTKDNCCSFIKPGELGCLIARDLLRENGGGTQKNYAKIRELLTKIYYRYLLL